VLPHRPEAALAGGVRCLWSTCRRSVGPNPPLVPSGPREFTLSPSQIPYVNLSIHTARVSARRLPPSAEPSGSSRFYLVWPKLNGDDLPPLLHEPKAGFAQPFAICRQCVWSVLMHAIGKKPDYRHRRLLRPRHGRWSNGEGHVGIERLEHIGVGPRGRRGRHARKEWVAAIFPTSPPFLSVPFLAFFHVDYAVGRSKLALKNAVKSM
jgi:hypothetical protein